MHRISCSFVAPQRPKWKRRSACQWHEAELGRLQCRRDFVFAGEWNGVFYRTKQIRPIFVDEPAEIIVVTVYVYYFPGERR